MENTSTPALQTSREFKAPKEQLYQAWTEEKALKEWWKPEQLELMAVENELKPEGKVNYRFKNQEGGEVSVNGTYQEVEPNEKLVYSWNWEIPTESKEDGNFTLCIVFKQKEQGSLLEVKQEPFSSPESVEIHKKAWETALNELDAYLSKGTEKGNEPSKASQESKANDVIGYNELKEQEKVGGYSA